MSTSQADCYCQELQPLRKFSKFCINVNRFQTVVSAMYTRSKRVSQSCADLRGRGGFLQVLNLENGSLIAEENQVQSHSADGDSVGGAGVDAARSV
jgi:hypothetical protein